MKVEEVLTINEKRIYWAPCPKHVPYLRSGYLVLSCKKCVIRTATSEDEAAIAGAVS